jgi:hypothetical protein
LDLESEYTLVAVKVVPDGMLCVELLISTWMVKKTKQFTEKLWLQEEASMVINLFITYLEEEHAPLENIIIWQEQMEEFYLIFFKFFQEFFLSRTNLQLGKRM